MIGINKLSVVSLLLGGVAMIAAPPVIKNQGFLPFGDGSIHYRSAEVDDPVARLEKRLERGEAQLEYDSKLGYLKSVLNALQVPASSQGLVFSKTSFQFPQITPANPRALYFNDDVYVGQVHGAKFLEFAAFDPRQGAIFYVLDARETDKPRFERAAVDCVQCHVASSTRGVPGVMLRSVFTRPSGYPAGGTKAFVTGQESPLNTRWGGWYVTALRGAETSMANTLATNSEHPEQLTKLSGPVNTANYLTGSSDIAALLVLAHQTQMHNLITQTTYKTRLRQPFEETAEQLVRYLLFTNEAKLDGPVVGNTSFTEDFEARGAKDSQGRSLRQFDLKTRIFRYPCSYLIYSETFDAIPAPAKQFIYRRLFEVLSGHDQSPEFKSLSAADRIAILEILVETKPGLPAEWRQYAETRKQLIFSNRKGEV